MDTWRFNIFNILDNGFKINRNIESPCVSFIGVVSLLYSNINTITRCNTILLAMYSMTAMSLILFFSLICLSVVLSNVPNSYGLLFFQLCQNKYNYFVLLYFFCIIYIIKVIYSVLVRLHLVLFFIPRTSYSND